MEKENSVGGMGSGSWSRWEKRKTSDTMFKLSISKLVKQKVVGAAHHWSGSWQWQEDNVKASISVKFDLGNGMSPFLTVAYLSEGERLEYQIPLEVTSPNYGGFRWWFRCPGTNCGRRCSVLYLREYLLCLRCQQMPYASQQEQRYERAVRRAWKVIDKLNGRFCERDWAPRPKGMHRRTYERHMAELDKQNGRAEAFFPARLKPFLKSF